MDRFESMSVLLAAVDGGSLSAAGRQLGMPLATVSRKLSELERQLKTRLLVRTTRSLALTDTGRLYVDACRRILDQVREAERTATGEYSEPKGQLLITAPIVLGRLHLLPVVTAFLDAYAQVDIRLRLSDQVVNLIEDRVDLALRVGELPDSNLVAIRVGSIGSVVCASPAYLARRGEPRRPSDLARHDCVVFDRLARPQTWTFRARRAQVDVPIHARLAVTTAEAAVDAAVAGAGLTRVLSYQAAEAIAAGRLKALLRSFEPPAWPASLVHGGQTPIPQKLRAFIDFAAPRLRAALAAAPA
jgi:DNA-binding transcriptional LysR family regulator